MGSVRTSEGTEGWGEGFGERLQLGLEPGEVSRGQRGHW